MLLLLEVVRSRYAHFAHTHADKAAFGYIKGYRHLEGQPECIRRILIVVKSLTADKPNLCRKGFPSATNVYKLGVRHLLLRRYIIAAAPQSLAYRGQVIILLTHKAIA